MFLPFFLFLSETGVVSKMCLSVDLHMATWAHQTYFIHPNPSPHKKTIYNLNIAFQFQQLLNHGKINSDFVPPNTKLFFILTQSQTINIADELLVPYWI